MPALLTLRFSDRPARRFTLEDGRAYLAGRAAGCDLRIDDDRVSRHHARFEHCGDSWRASDLGSKNGLRIDGRTLASSAVLPERCWLSLGGLLARFEQVDEAELRALEEHDRDLWQTSLELQRGLEPKAGLPRLLEQILDSVLRLSGAERGYVLLAGGDGALEVAAAAGVAVVERPDGGFPGSAGAVERARSGSGPVATCDARDDAALGGRPSVSAEGIRALVCVPLEGPAGCLGVIYADSRVPGSAFTELDVEILGAFAEQAALAIHAARISREAEDLFSELPTSWRDAPSVAV